MVNETQSFAQYKDRAQSIGTDVISRIIGSENYQQKLVPGWVDSIGQEIVNKLRVRFIPLLFVHSRVGVVIGFQIHSVGDDSGEEGSTGPIFHMLLGCRGGLSCDCEMGKSAFALCSCALRSGALETPVFISPAELYRIAFTLGVQYMHRMNISRLHY